jgi:hypothetical protein
MWDLAVNPSDQLLYDLAAMNEVGTIIGGVHARLDPPRTLLGHAHLSRAHATINDTTR